MSLLAYDGTVLGEYASNLDGDAGTVRLEIVPAANAFPPSGVEEVILEMATPAGDFELVWNGNTIGSGEYYDFAYLGLRVAGVFVARCYTFHVAGATLRVRIDWGSGFGRPHLHVDGWSCQRFATAAVLPFTPAASVSAGRRADLSLPWSGIVQNLELYSTRLSVPRLWAVLGDSLSQDPQTATTRAWDRQWTSLADRGNLDIFLNAARDGDRFEHLLSRLSVEILQQGPPSRCYVLCGINNIVAGDSAAQIATLATELYAALRTAAIVPIALTLLPFGNAAQWTSARQNVWDQLCAWIRQGASVLHRDLGSEMTTPGSPSTRPTLIAAYDIGDGLHLSQAGSDRVGELLRSWTSSRK